jgi:hypothetical protein
VRTPSAGGASADGHGSRRRKTRRNPGAIRHIRATQRHQELKGAIFDWKDASAMRPFPAPNLRAGRRGRQPGDRRRAKVLVDQDLRPASLA